MGHGMQDRLGLRMQNQRVTFRKQFCYLPPSSSSNISKSCLSLIANAVGTGRADDAGAVDEDGRSGRVGETGEDVAGAEEELVLLC